MKSLSFYIFLLKKLAKKEFLGIHMTVSTINAEIIISEYAQVKFSVLGSNKVFQFEQAFGYIKGLFDSHDKISITDVVVCRSIVIQLSNGSLRHEQQMCIGSESYNPEKFLKMMQYEKGISNNAWVDYISSVSLENKK